MERDRKTEAGVSVESRIRENLTHFFELHEQDQAYEKAREIKSYVYPCYETVEDKFTLAGKTHSRKITKHVGYCVPV